MPAAIDFRLLSDAERQASMEKSLAHWDAHDDLWVFGYGSLVWRPDFDFTEQRVAMSHGYHLALCLWSRVNRFTPERPWRSEERRVGKEVVRTCRSRCLA